ncbi:beta-galactosidase [Bacillus marinisedimentorum]|uniref:beta-galactosidase n=1 Tax=Bacillus marinisedimentorum TaxID=1821260 RepID=UPI0007E27DB9|nr:beta-galactosidase [Bacillus marinisedimentorum]
MAKFVKNKEFQLGVCYYPEHWPEDLWADDFKRMIELGFSTIRIGEFAWSVFEPVEGEFHFELFDRAIDLAHQYGLKVVLGTPTATPPAWLTHKHPEVLNVSQQGVQYQHGQRRHYNYNSEVYKKFTERIVREMASHYKNHPAVIGWQIDNELNCETNVFYSEADHHAFRIWAKEKYETLDKLNEAWGTVFWNQTYTDWEQIKLTGPTISDSPNPHHSLDEKRFFSDSAISYAKLQNNIIRELAPHQWVTTNGMFGHLNNHKMTEDLLDFFAYDSYPNFSTIYPDTGEKPLLDRKWSWNLSNVRSISPSFAVFEQQSGPGGWVNRMEQPSPKPGQMRLWTYQSIAHGADMLLYFRWRTATKGTEIYWHGINDYHNQPNRRVSEARQIGEELSRIGNKIKGSEYQAEAAILRDYDNEWDGEMDLWHGPLSAKSNLEWFKAFQYKHIPVDVQYLFEDSTVDQIKKYKILIYPHPAILSKETADLLTEYVKQGGTLVFGSRTGYKDTSGQCYMKPFPGEASELAGATVEEFSLVAHTQEGPAFRWNQREFKNESFFEILKVQAKGIEVLARYEGSYYDGKPALVKNKVGNGSVYYFGGTFTEELAGMILSHADIHSVVDGSMALPQEMELSVRENTDGSKYYFLLNYSDRVQEIELKEPFINLLSGEAVNGVFDLEPFGVSVFHKR